MKIYASKHFADHCFKHIINTIGTRAALSLIFHFKSTVMLNYEEQFYDELIVDFRNTCIPIHHYYIIH